MALSQSVVWELLDASRSGEGIDLVRESVRLVMQELIEAEAAERIGAARYERTESQVAERNGARPRLLATQAGEVELRIPKLRKGSFLPAILEPRRRIDQTLYAVLMEGLHPRDVHVQHRRPGRRPRRRLRRVQVRGVPDLRRAGGRANPALPGRRPPALPVHFARNLLARVPKSHADLAAAVFRTALAQPDAATVAATWDQVRDQLAARFLRIGPLMDEAKTEVLAFTALRPHWSKVWSTNPLERVNKEIKRRARVVEILPNDAA